MTAFPLTPPRTMGETVLEPPTWDCPSGRGQAKGLIDWRKNC